MLPTRHFGNFKPESWLGLLDSTYAIILTLMVIELPALVAELINHVRHHHGTLYILIRLLAVHVLAYVAMFMIVYEIWSIHRSILTISQPSRHRTIFAGAILAVASFMPPLVQMANGYRQAYILSGDPQDRVVIEVIRIFIYLALLLIYFLLQLSARRSLLRIEDGGSAEADRDLRSLISVARHRGLLVMAVYLFSLAFPVGGPFYLVSFALLAYFGADLLRFGRRCLLPQQGSR
jgi:uncharacterized membrane protein